MVTSYPGPNTQNYLSTVSGYTKDANTIQYIIDYKKSLGNYFCDIDKNVVLDLEAQDGTLPFGYNDKDMVKLLKSDSLDSFLMNGQSMYMYPNFKLQASIIPNILRNVSSENMTEVLFSDGTSTNAIELAIRMALLNSKNKNAQIALLGDCIYGSSYGTLMPLNIKSESSVDLKILRLPFPNLKYPLKANSENANEEKVCLDKIQNALTGPVAAIIVSPMQVNLQVICSFHRIIQHLITFMQRSEK